MLKAFTKAAAAGVMMIALQVEAPEASARVYHHHHYSNYRSHPVAHRARVCRNRGTGIGIVAGALIGNSLGGHNRTTGTIAGAAVGGVTGHAIAQSECRRRYSRR